MGRILYTSDLHFGHFNAIRFDKRPWETVEEMDEGLVQRWNAIASLSHWDKETG